MVAARPRTWECCGRPVSWGPPLPPGVLLPVLGCFGVPGSPWKKPVFRQCVSVREMRRGAVNEGIRGAERSVDCEVKS